MTKNAISETGDAATYVERWLDHAASTRGWMEQEAAIRQYALF